MEKEYVDEKEELQKKLDVLKKNRESISKEDLETKYAKAYQKLLSEINALMNEIMFTELFFFLYTVDFLEKGRDLVAEEMKKKSKMLSKALYTDYSAQEFVNLLREIHHEIISQYMTEEHDFSTQSRCRINPFIDKGKCLVSLAA